MKIAVVYNRDSKAVLQTFGPQNKERIGMKTIRNISAALEQAGHEVVAVEADKHLLARLEELMPRMAFNVAYGIQGHARYTHAPSMLEMAGIPYVASSPLGHALSLDKVVTKILLSSAGIPTPAYQVLERKGDPLKPGLRWPLVVKPRHEAVSFGLRVCREEPELREGAQVILQTYQQPVLVEEYIEGREVNVAILGNSPPVALPPVELDFGDGPRIYTYEDKTHRSGRTIGMLCPAPIGEELTARVQDLARRAFSAVGLLDCCRVDMRIAEDGGVWVLETNSLPSLGEHGSYVEAALKAGFTFNGLVNRILEVAEQRYFGA